MQRKIIIIATFLIIVFGAFALMEFLESTKEESVTKATTKKVVYVKAIPVSFEDKEVSVTATGRLTSQSLVDISSEVQGKILKGNIELKKGQSFRKGDLLLKVYNKEFALSIQSGKSRFLTSIANILPDIKVDYPGSYDLWSNFFDAVKIDSDLPDLPEIESRQEKIFLASRNILSDYYSIKSSELRLEKYSIYAPFNGVYTQVYNEVGSVANPGARLAQIIRTDKLELEVPVNTRDIKWLKIGDETIVKNEDESMSWKGRVIRIAKYVDPTTQSISVFVKLNSESSKPLYNGQYLKAEFPGKVITDGFEIPRNSVFNYNEIFVVIDGKLQKRTIEVKKVGDNSIIISGIEEGISIVVESLVNAVVNTEVEIIE